jgi:hypothetical protein
MSRTIRDGGLVQKDPSDVNVYEFDWGTLHLGVGVTIISSVFTVAAVRPASATVPTLTSSGSGLGIQPGSRSTKVKVTGGTLGAVYELTNTITTSETPSQTKDRMCRIKVANL